MSRQLLKLKIMICNMLIKNEKLKFPIHKIAFMDACKSIKKDEHRDTYSKTLVCMRMASLIRYKGRSDKYFGYNIDVHYFFQLYDDLIESKYITPLNGGDNFEINYIDIAKNFWNKTIPISISAITTLIVNYILFLVTKK